VRLGVMVLPTDETMPPTDLAIAVEERGLLSLFLPEHTHIPTSRRTPYPGGEPLKPEFRRLLDPMVALAMAAAVTSTIELGTGVMLVNEHHPIDNAKRIATLDHLSGGRFVLGAGSGWNEDEMEHHGVNPKRRNTVLRENLLAMIELWTKETAAFDGDYVKFSESWMWPKPARAPHPPILLGGGPTPAVFKRVVEFCDGWFPIGGAGLPEHIAELRRFAEEAGRDPDTISINIFGAFPDRRKLSWYQALGVDRVVMGLPPAPRFTDIRGAGADKILPVLDDYAELVKEFHQ
jgi:probable F420-dependent oxidoreductase